MKNGFLVSDTSLYFRFIDFSSNHGDSSFTGNNGCLSGVQRGYHVILSIEKGLLPLNKKYTARFWMYNDGKNYGQDRLDGWIFFQKRKGENVAWLAPIIIATCSHEINGNWSLVEISFDHTDSEAAYDLVLKGNDIAEENFYIDDLLFYDNDLLIYRLDSTKNKSVLFKNNHRIEMPGKNL